MALAYAIVLVNTEMYTQQKRDALHEAQKAADSRFEAIAQENMKTLVTRNPEPREMTYPEMRQQFPSLNLDGLVGLYFTADIA